MEIVLNGSARSVPEACTVAELLAFLEVPVDRVAVERNRAIVRKPDWPVTKIEHGDEVEVVHFVGGG